LTDEPRDGSEHDPDDVFEPVADRESDAARAGRPAHDDSFWRFEKHVSAPRSVNWLQIGLVALVVAAIVVVVVGRRADDDQADGGSADTTAVAGDSTTTPTASTTPAVSWEPSADGRPAVLGDMGTPPDRTAADVAPGAYLWSDFQGWHLWVVTGTGVDGVVATLTSDDGFATATAVGTTGTATTAGRSLTFTPTAGTRVAGVDFQPGFYAKVLTVDLTGADGQRLTPTVVHVGGSATSPPAVPVILTKPEG